MSAPPPELPRHAPLSDDVSDSEQPPPPPPPADQVPFLSDVLPCKYIKRRNIGRGEYGEAWIAQRVSDDKMFVAKVMNLANTPEKRRRYALGEIRCLSNCRHPNIIRYEEDSGTNGEHAVIIMELADASDLQTQLSSSGVTFTEREAGILFVQLTLALHHVHKRRVIHRDIKSSNVFLTTSGLVKLGDFGFSQQFDATVSGSVAGTFLGTPYYLAPEMWNGRRYGKKTDIWAAGIVLYETLAKKRPYLGQSIDDLKATVLNGRIDRIPNVSGDMMELIVTTLHPDPRQRPSTSELLRLPLMQHFTTMYVNIVTRDAALDAELKSEILATVAEAQQDVASLKMGEECSDDPRHEGTVLKETEGKWKERVLILQPPQLIMTLAHGKEAAPGTDRSKRINLANVKTATKLQEVPNATSKSVTPRLLFALELHNGSNIVFAVTTEAERDVWMQKLHRALEMS